MKKTLLFCMLLAAGTNAQATEQESKHAAMLEEVTARLAALDTQEETHLGRDFAAGAAAIGVGGAAMVALKRGDITELRGMLGDLSNKISGQHSLTYPAWLPSAAGWGVLGLVCLGVYDHFRISALTADVKLTHKFFSNFDEQSFTQGKKITELSTKMSQVVKLITARRKLQESSVPESTVHLDGDQPDNDNL